MKLLVNAPINSLSFGNVTVNILKEFYKKNIDIIFFPIGDKIELEAFDKTDQQFKDSLQQSINNRFSKIEKDTPTFKLWHIFGSENRLTKNQNLFTFHETSDITDIERSILNLQDNVFVSSSYTKSVFECHNVQNVHHVPLGFDSDFFETKNSNEDDRIHFGIMGKFENRKNTSRIIKAWLKVFGNNNKYVLHCAVSNPFLDQNKFQLEIIKLMDGKNYNNINFIPRMQTNSEVNDFLNSIDIDLGGLSGGEGWNLPSFNATALGKWSVVLNATSHKDWATKQNSILIEPTQLKDSHDGIFFVKGQAFNQGSFYDIRDDQIESAILESVKYAKVKNIEGQKLQQKTYSQTADKILSVIFNK